MSKKEDDNSFSAHDVEPKASGWGGVQVQKRGYDSQGVTSPAQQKPKPTVTKNPIQTTNDIEFPPMVDESPPWGATVKTGYVRCYETHPPLPIQVDGKTYYVRGGSCRVAPPEGTDIFIGFDTGMVLTKAAYPWTAGIEFLFPIKDMGVPASLHQFKKMLAWLKVQILSGSSVYMGCIGGHGRTGLVMAALVTLMTGEKDSTTYIRKHYCKKVVESEAQVDWLFDHFGITKVHATKGFNRKAKTAGENFGGIHSVPHSKYVENTKKKKRTDTVIKHFAVKGNIHGHNNI